ncbi:hypothetical protein BGAL_0344g00040 [Botrytis galanthina]|uniref:Uncharacterized protein n=1 Tax=Botrytis galanthina TaxID=278940 RepID=A0A4S8QT08_9HELO|nr:hypothetical protein BGAL_0344g00040 [Botrytis galanthina]
MQELERDRSSTGTTWGPTYRKIQDLEELAKDVDGITKFLGPLQAKEALKDLMRRKGHHLPKETNALEVDVPEQ